MARTITPERMLKLRTEMGISQTTLAKELGYSNASQVSMMEKGHREISMDVSNKIRALHLKYKEGKLRLPQAKRPGPKPGSVGRKNRTEIGELRIKLNLTQAQVGELIGTDHTTVSRYENGEYKVPEKTLARLRKMVRDRRPARKKKSVRAR